VAVRGSKIWEVICTRASFNVQMWDQSVYMCKCSEMAHMVCAHSSLFPEITECLDCAIYVRSFPSGRKAWQARPRAYHVPADSVDMPYPGRYGSRLLVGLQYQARPSVRPILGTTDFRSWIVRDFHSDVAISSICVTHFGGAG
jgi:hypothetical protein